MTAVTDDVLKFTGDTGYDELPEEIVHEAKRSLLDSIGTVFTGAATEKGKIAMNLGNRLGGTPESSVIGTTMRISCTNAAMVNSELMYSLDFDPVPHITPFVIPPVLAVAESIHASGKDVILATAIGQEIARRINDSMNVLEAKVAGEARTPDIFGNSNEHMLGAAVAVGKLLALDDERLGNALGIAGYLCSLPTGRDWEDTMPKSIIKYAPAGWNCNAAVTAALLAEQGYTGSRNMLDNQFGFHVFYGASVWSPEKIAEGLGEVWKFTNCMYKLYPCCRFLQSSLDCLLDLMAEHQFRPSEIESINAYSLPFLAHPDQHKVSTQVDTQYSFPYAAAAAVHGIRPGVDWQDMNIINDPEIQTTMKKINIYGDPRAGAEKAKDPRSWYARVEIAARGTTYIKETLYSKGTNIEGYRLSDEVLVRKFRHNATRILAVGKIEKAIDCIWNLEKASDISELIKLVTI
jgi:2-methylcitrate dehydratase PrpD